MAGETIRPIAPLPARATAGLVWLVRHRALVLGLAIAVTVPAAFRMAKLYGALRSDLEELLPSSSRGVRAIAVLRERIPSMQHLGIIVRGPTAGPPAQFALELGRRLAAYPPDLVRLVRTDVSDERRFLRDRWPLYLDLPDLQRIRDYASEQLRRETMAHNPLYVELGDDAAQRPRRLDDLDAWFQRADPFEGRFPDDRLVSGDGRTAVVLAFLAVMDTGSSRMGPLVDRVRADIAALNPTAQGLEVGLAGDVAINVEELAALQSDLAVSGGLVLLAVIASIIIYFRWWRAVPALALPLVGGTTWGFGLASLGISHLNISTAFLGSIVIGNGINPGIILLARFVEERRSGYTFGSALERAVRGTWKGTLAATVAAASGYSTLIATDFRGFRQFGVIGALGVICCWIAAYLLTPPLLSLLDQPRLEAPLRSARRAWIARIVPSLIARWPREVVVTAAVITIAAAIVAARFDRSRVESDWSKLRSRGSPVRGEGYWNERLEAVMGRNFSSIVLLTETHEQAARVAAMVKSAAARAPLSRAVSRVIGPDELVPPFQDAKREELRAIERVLARFPTDELPLATRARIDGLRAAAHLPAITPRDLPPLYTHGVVEKDGRFGRTVLVLQGLGGATWDGRLAVDATRQLHAIADSMSPPAHVAGGIVIAALVLETLEREAPRVTALAFLAVAVLVALTFRRVRAWVPVLAALLCSVTWLAAAVIVLDQRINFINFIAFPITFGIGVEYAINVLQRHEQSPGDVEAVVRNTGGAVVLCSLTTIWGYSSLLLAQNRALFSFGVLAVLGEIFAIAVAVIAMPAALAWSSRGTGRASGLAPIDRSR